MAEACERAGGSGVPELLVDQLRGALKTLAKAVDARDRPGPARRPSGSSRPPSTCSSATGRRPWSTATASTLWARQLLLDAAARDRGAVAGDAATLQVIWDRAGHGAEPAAAERVAAGLTAVGKAAAGKDVTAAAAAIPLLRTALAGLTP
jgi:hypothetical protein